MPNISMTMFSSGLPRWTVRESPHITNNCRLGLTHPIPKCAGEVFRREGDSSAAPTARRSGASLWISSSGGATGAVWLAVLEHGVRGRRSDVASCLIAACFEGTLTRLEAVDLAFDLDQIRSLVEQYDINIEPQHLALIEQTTQGWGALIRLAAHCIAQRDGLPQALHEFTHTPSRVGFPRGKVLAVSSI